VLAAVDFQRTERAVRAGADGAAAARAGAVVDLPHLEAARDAAVLREVHGTARDLDAAGRLGGHFRRDRRPVAPKMFMVAEKTARKWVDRYRDEGEAGMVDRTIGQIEYIRLVARLGCKVFAQNSAPQWFPFGSGCDAFRRVSSHEFRPLIINDRDWARPR
jgi:hypothetical protein